MAFAAQSSILIKRIFIFEVSGIPAADAGEGHNIAATVKRKIRLFMAEFPFQKTLKNIPTNVLTF